MQAIVQKRSREHLFFYMLITPRGTPKDLDSIASGHDCCLRLRVLLCVVFMLVQEFFFLDFWFRENDKRLNPAKQKIAESAGDGAKPDPIQDVVLDNFLSQKGDLDIFDVFSCS